MNLPNTGPLPASSIPMMQGFVFVHSGISDSIIHGSKLFCSKVERSILNEGKRWTFRGGRQTLPAKSSLDPEFA